MKVKWEVTTEQSPYHLPPLFGGARFLVFGFVPKDTKEGSVTLSGSSHILPTGRRLKQIIAKAGAKDFTTTVKWDLSKPVAGNMIMALAAKSMIRDLEEGRSYLHDLDGKLVKGTEQTVKEKIIKLSIQHSILSKFTAFVAGPFFFFFQLSLFAELFQWRREKMQLKEK